MHYVPFCTYYKTCTFSFCVCHKVYTFSLCVCHKTCTLSLSMHTSNRWIHSDQKLCHQVWQTSETMFWPDLALLRYRRQLAGMCSQPFLIETLEWSIDRIEFWGLYSHHLTCHQLNTSGGSVQDKLEPFHCADLQNKGYRRWILLVFRLQTCSRWTVLVFRLQTCILVRQHSITLVTTNLRLNSWEAAMTNMFKVYTEHSPNFPQWTERPSPLTGHFSC